MLSEAKIRGRLLELDLWYPGVADRVDTVELGLVDVRAADSIRISFDFERDGYSAAAGFHSGTISLISAHARSVGRSVRGTRRPRDHSCVTSP